MSHTKKIALLLISCLLFCGPVFAEAFTIIHVPDLKKLLAEPNKKVTVLDANGKKTRQENGVIPGAVELSSSSSYAESELPKDKNQKLVFYCYNQKCTASHTAAERATTLGYKDVNVLSDGIVGWNSAS